MERNLSAREFEALVGSALDELPEDLARQISNLDVFVEESPSQEDLQDGEAASDLLGLYQGIPLTERESDYWGVLPDRITLFRRNLEDAAESPEHLKALVRETVIHEVAHHFGIDDDRLDELGWS